MAVGETIMTHEMWKGYQANIPGLVVTFGDEL